MKRLQLLSGDDPEIVQFFHCRACMQELLTAAPSGTFSPRDEARLEVGLTAEGDVSVRCVKHDRPVVLVRPEIEETDATERPD